MLTRHIWFSLPFSPVEIKLRFTDKYCKEFGSRYCIQVITVLNALFPQVKTQPGLGQRSCCLLFTGVRSNQDLIWCVKIGVYMGFSLRRGS